MALTATGSKPKKKDTRTKTAVKNIERVHTGKGVELWHIRKIYDTLGPDYISKAQLNKLKKQGYAKKSGGTVKRKSGGSLGIGKALRGGGAVRKR
jgi:hypothetical protein